MGRRPSRFLKLFVLLLIALALLALTHSWWMAGLARPLVSDDGPAKADIAVVLAGDFSGNRILKGGELVKDGYVPKVLVSGPHMLYGMYECDPAIAFAGRHGYPESYFVRAPHEALSTREEAAAILPELRNLGVHRFLLVTSDYHTARAARVFRAAGSDFVIRTVAAPDNHFRVDGWWRDREGQKIVFMEWSKTIANALGM
ncbi:MAG: YdcF family protein [Bryobacteraceae bacterium]